jgi:hypothetical protein
MPIPPAPNSALVDAMGRFDRELRSVPEWAGWEQNKAHLYAIEHDGSRYPVKHIVSMATGVPVSEFSGGKASGDANAFVTVRGFHIVELRSGRNPTWVRDELILALDMYLRYAGNPPSKESAEIIELSATLNRLARYLGLSREDRFRNRNGVYMKLMNFRRFDPAFIDAGKVGLSRGGKTEEEVWTNFAHDPARCHQVAETIRGALAAVPDDDLIISGLVGDEIDEAEEGRVITAMHRRYERDARIVRAKKKQALALSGRLTCEACDFDFRAQ